MDYDQPAASGSYRVFIYNVGEDATELDLYSLVSPYGAVAKVDVVKDPATDKAKGFAFVTFHDYTSAWNAIQCLDGHPYAKNKFKKLQVSFKTESKSK